VRPQRLKTRARIGKLPITIDTIPVQSAGLELRDEAGKVPCFFAGKREQLAMVSLNHYLYALAFRRPHAESYAFAMHICSAV
jgi:hypothetical protein